MDNSYNTKLSKFLSLILRHKPEEIDICLDENGWADVSELINGINNTGRKINFELLKEIVKTDNKGRYSFNEDMTKIRANQGHSINVDVNLKEIIPPDVLYHGTAERFILNILDKKQGLKSMSRLYVHMSKDYDTAVKVGVRHGNPIVLKIDAKQMKKDGYVFYLSENGVFLTKTVPYKYLEKVKL